MRLFLYKTSVLFYIVLLLFYQATLPAKADETFGFKILRDTEIEQLLKDYTSPLLEAAELTKKKIPIVVLKQESFNAFTDGYSLFIQSGAILHSKTPNQLIGVLAHEIGHIAHGHLLITLNNKLPPVLTALALGSLISLGTLSTGIWRDDPKLINTGGALLYSGIDSFKRDILSHMRDAENAADRSALTYLEKSKQSAKGFLETLSYFQKEQILQNAHQTDPYLISHPHPKERFAALVEKARLSPYYKCEDSFALLKRHQFAHAKLAGLSFADKQSIYRFFRNKRDSKDALQYGLAIYEVKENLPQAKDRLQTLLKRYPKNPFFHEALGDYYLKNQAFVKASDCYKQAIKYQYSSSSLFYFRYAHALIKAVFAKQKNEQALSEAADILCQAIDIEPTMPALYQELIAIYSQLNEPALVDLYSADMYYYQNDQQRAYSFANRALKQLQPKTPEYLHAEDILMAIKATL